jgi:hypothetical protein
MALNLVARAKDQIRATWKLCLSFRKSDWELSDYPVVVREQEPDLNYDGTRLKQHRYFASIVNWGLAGLGDSERESLQDLQSRLLTAKAERAKTGKPLPRPGKRFPIGFASQVRVSANSELAEDFVHRVLELDWAFISDESSLWDFHHDETNEALLAKIEDVYGVDVSEIESAKLSEIFERIAAARESLPR